MKKETSSYEELQKKADEIEKIARENGGDKSFYFLTTFRHYRRLLQTCEDLSQQIEENSTVVTKEYVKGRQNLYINPAVAAYNSTVAIANKTTETLMRIIRDMGDEGTESDDDPLLKALRGD